MEKMRKLMILSARPIPHRKERIDFTQHKNLEAIMHGVKEAYSTSMKSHNTAMRDSRFREAVESGKAVPRLDKRLQVYVADINKFKNGKIEGGFYFNPKTEKWEVVGGIKPDFVFARITPLGLRRFTHPEEPGEFEKKHGFIFLNPYEYGKVISDKITTYNTLKQNRNIRMPKTEVARTKKEALQAVAGFGGEKILVKPAGGHDAAGQRVFESKEDALKAIASDEMDWSEGQVFQEFLPQAYSDSWRLHVSTRIDPKTGKLVMLAHTPFRKLNLEGKLADFNKEPATIEAQIDMASKEGIKLRLMAKEVVSDLAKQTGTLPQFSALDFAMVGKEGKKEPVFLEANYTPGVLRTYIPDYDKENPTEKDLKEFKQIALHLINAATEIDGNRWKIG